MTIPKHINKQNYVRNGRKANQMWQGREGNGLKKKTSCQLQQNLAAASSEDINVPPFTWNEAGTFTGSPVLLLLSFCFHTEKGAVRLGSTDVAFLKVKLM